MDTTEIKSDQNIKYKYCFVVVDHFTSYTWLFPMKDRSASTTLPLIKQVVEEIKSWNIIYKGEVMHARSIHTDNGGEVLGSKDITQYCHQEEIETRPGPPHHPQTQGKVERKNKELKDCITRLSEFLNNNVKHWHLHLLTLRISMNTKHNHHQPHHYRHHHHCRL